MAAAMVEAVEATVAATAEAGAMETVADTGTVMEGAAMVEVAVAMAVVAATAIGIEHPHGWKAMLRAAPKLGMAASSEDRHTLASVGLSQRQCARHHHCARHAFPQQCIGHCGHVTSAVVHLVSCILNRGMYDIPLWHAKWLN
mmetsp:Transcript_8570/g.25680  ORF Transcript_8570/g.25680 Transcript_8570/m.25680 type:complete len:143 (-) Transcript_8570:5789-6217(-)